LRNNTQGDCFMLIVHCSGSGTLFVCCCNLFFLGNLTFQPFKRPFGGLNRPLLGLFYNKKWCYTVLYRKPHNLQIGYPVHLQAYPLFICGSNIQSFRRIGKRVLQEGSLKKNYLFHVWTCIHVKPNLTRRVSSRFLSQPV
jgi:hypothetical protein